LKLVPAHAGIFRILPARPAITQQALATALGTLPGRAVALADELEAKGLLERRPHESDRRSYALHLTQSGHSTLKAIGRIARDRQNAMPAGLSEGPAAATCRTFATVADQQGLIPLVHPATGVAARRAEGSLEAIAGFEGCYFL
jgi:DNA-binding MarR family transcriptional regulator